MTHNCFQGAAATQAVCALNIFFRQKVLAVKEIMLTFASVKADVFK